MNLSLILDMAAGGFGERVVVGVEGGVLGAVGQRGQGDGERALRGRALHDGEPVFDLLECDAGGWRPGHERGDR